MTDPNELIVQLIGCLPLVDEGPDHKLWCSVRGDWLRAAVAALTPAPAQPEPPIIGHMKQAERAAISPEAMSLLNAVIGGPDAPKPKGPTREDQMKAFVAEANQAEKFKPRKPKLEPLPAGVEPVGTLFKAAGGLSGVKLNTAGERLIDAAYPLFVRTTPPTLTDAQCDATKDAERYRWLRQFSYPLDGILEVLTTSTDDQPPTHLYGDYLDAAIDRALIRAAAAGAG